MSPPEAERSPRQVQMHALFDVSRGRGLEIGPLNSPLVARDEADIRYVDVHDRAGLQDAYRSHENFPLEQIEEPDFVLLGRDGMRSLPAVAGACTYDWVVASHVIEHVPDLVTWLHEVAEVLTDDGVLVLAVPDRRFSFDVDRDTTTVGEMLLAHRSRDQRPSVRAVYDHFSRCMHIDPAHVWRHQAPGPRMYDLEFVLGQVAESESGTYVDCHVWVWTPAGFVEQLADLAAMGLTDLVVERVVDTAFDELEFYARLRRLPRGLDDAGRAEQRARAVTTWTDVEPPPLLRPAGGVDDDPEAVAASLSASEARLVLLKRRAVHRARRLLRFPSR